MISKKSPSNKFDGLFSNHDFENTNEIISTLSTLNLPQQLSL